MRTGRRGWLRVALVGSLVVGGALGASVASGTRPASDGSVVRTLCVGPDPDGVSSDGTRVWVTNVGGNTVTELTATDGLAGFRITTSSLRAVPGSPTVR